METRTYPVLLDGEVRRIPFVETPVEVPDYPAVALYAHGNGLVKVVNKDDHTLIVCSGGWDVEGRVYISDVAGAKRDYLEPNDWSLAILAAILWVNNETTLLTKEEATRVGLPAVGLYTETSMWEMYCE